MADRGAPDTSLLAAARAVCENPSEEEDWEVVRASDLARLRAVVADTRAETAFERDLRERMQDPEFRENFERESCRIVVDRRPE